MFRGRKYENGRMFLNTETEKSFLFHK